MVLALAGRFDDDKLHGGAEAPLTRMYVRARVASSAQPRQVPTLQICRQTRKKPNPSSTSTTANTATSGSTRTDARTAPRLELQRPASRPPPAASARGISADRRRSSRTPPGTPARGRRNRAEHFRAAPGSGNEVQRQQHDHAIDRRPAEHPGWKLRPRPAPCQLRADCLSC